MVDLLGRPHSKALSFTVSLSPICLVFTVYVYLFGLPGSCPAVSDF